MLSPMGDVSQKDAKKKKCLKNYLVGDFWAEGDASLKIILPINNLVGILIFSPYVRSSHSSQKYIFHSQLSNCNCQRKTDTHLLPKTFVARGSHTLDPFGAQARTPMFSYDRAGGHRVLATKF